MSFPQPPGPPRDWNQTQTEALGTPHTEIVGRGRSWTAQSFSAFTSTDGADRFGSYAPESITAAPDQWGKSSSAKPTAANEKSWGKHRTERANLDKKERLIQETIDTERSYVHSLETMTKHYAQPLKDSPAKFGVKPEQVAAVFENIEPIAGFHVIFLLELEKIRNPAQTILKFGDFLKMYTTFTSSYDKCVRLLGQMRKSTKFTKFLEDTRQDPECKGLDLLSFMIMPIQRIPRYELLLRELISCSEADPDLTQAYDRIRYIAKHVNETQRHVENMIKLLEIQDRITNSELTFELLQPHRRLLKESHVQQKTTSKLNKYKQRFLFLFSDIILWTSSSHSYLGHLDLSCIAIKSNAKHPDVTFMISNESSKDLADMIWRCDTPEECSAWRKAIDEAMQKLCEVFVSRLDEKDRERFGQLSTDANVDKADVLRQAKMSARRKKYERQQGGALHTFMKEKLQELQQNTADNNEKSFSSNDVAERGPYQ